MGQECIKQGCNVLGIAIKDTQTCMEMMDIGFPMFTTVNKLSLLTTQLSSLLKWIKDNNVTVIHCHKSGDLLVAAVIKQFLNIKIIFTEHMGSKRSKKDIYHRWIYKNVDQVLSISDETYQRNLKALPISSDKITRLWLGTPISEKILYDEDSLRPIKNQLNIDPSSYIIGTLGRISLGKGLIELVKAFSLVKSSIPNSQLLIVGGLEKSQGCDLHYLTHVKRLITKLHLEDDVIFTGFRRDSQTQLAIMNVVCLPYKNEAFGLTAIEAMAAQRPIIAANTGALPELLHNTALYCTPDDEHSICHAIMLTYQNKQKAEKRAEQARERAVREFSLSTHIQSLLDYYQDE